MAEEDPSILVEMHALGTRPKPAHPRLLVCLGVAWSVALIIGLAGLVHYEGLVGTASAPPQQWPADCALGRDLDQPTLLVFAHPQCPCTRATLSEIDKIEARCGGNLHTVVILLHLPKRGERWNRSDLWYTAARIPGVQVRPDSDGILARQFGVETSGKVLMYGADGSLAFQGGITPARNHKGRNAGADAIVALAHLRKPKVVSTPVHGCEMFCKPEREDQGRQP